MQLSTLNNTSSSHAPSALPLLKSDGPLVAAASHRAAGTGLWLTLAYGVLALVVIVSLGTTLLALALGWVIDHAFSRRVLARVRGSSLQVGPHQLPEIEQCVRNFAMRLSMAEPPMVLVAEASELNAIALRIGKRKCILLLDDVIWGAVEYGLPDALRFVIAHELAHHALGHTGALRSYLRIVVPRLSRLDELSADAVALQLVGTREAAHEGLMMLTVGPQLLKYINREQLLRQASEVTRDKATRKAERPLTHPLLMRRLQMLCEVPLADGSTSLASATRSR
jgi:Zn-dependent protease with chaperone function